jgi:hypothetical protein
LLNKIVKRLFNLFVIPAKFLLRKPFVTTEYHLKEVTIPQKGQPIHGAVGQVIYKGNMTEYIPYVDLCSQLHIGKQATRGCGGFIYERG